MHESSSESSIEQGNYPSVINLYAVGQKPSSSQQGVHFSKNHSEIITKTKKSDSTFYDVSRVASNVPEGTIYTNNAVNSYIPLKLSNPGSDSDSSDTIPEIPRRRKSTTSTSSNSSSNEKLAERIHAARVRAALPTPTPPGTLQSGASFMHHQPSPLHPHHQLILQQQQQHSPMIHSPMQLVHQPLNIIASPSPSSNTMSSGGGGSAVTVRRQQQQRQMVSQLVSLQGRIETSLAQAVNRVTMRSHAADSGISNTSGETQSSTEFHQRNIDSQFGGSNMSDPVPPPAPPLPQSILKGSRDHQTANQMEAAFKACLFNLLSIMYAMLLISLGILLPLTELVAEDVPLHAFEGFYIYLYVLAILFLLYVYFFLMSRPSKSQLLRNRRYPSAANDGYSMRILGSEERGGPGSPCLSRKQRLRLTTSHWSATAAGSFYLRLGVVGFGIASMVRDGLRCGRILDAGLQLGGCNSPVHLVRAIGSLLFTFIQLYFIFLNSKICVHKYKVLARFGLMHLIGTNFCVWFHGIIKESFTEPPSWIHASQQQMQLSVLTGPSGSPNVILLADHKSGDGILSLKKNVSMDCVSGDLMEDVVRNSSPYLAPCTAQYSILAIGLLWITWRNIGKLFPQDSSTTSAHTSPQVVRHTPTYTAPATSTVPTSHRASVLLRSQLSRLQPVDCAGSNRGLFLGLTALLATVVAILLLHVLLKRPAYTPIGLGLAYSTELALAMCAAGASLAACFRMQDMLFQPAPNHSRLDTIFLLLGLTGVITHSLIGILAGRYLSRGQGAPFVVMSGLVNLIQAGIQAVFVSTALRRTSYKAQHRLEKPGRQLVTFLLMTNLALWLINIFDHVRLAGVHLHVVFFGGPTISLLMNVTLPLIMFYRFHACVSLAVIWTRAYRLDHE